MVLQVKLPVETYYRFQRSGLLDSEHRMGDEYPASKHETVDKDSVWVPVLYYSPPLKFYTIIAAKPPVGYLTGPKVHLCLLNPIITSTLDIPLSPLIGGCN